ncbi:MAG: glutamate synthase [Thermoanaerobaculia bacterium]|nr:glutamate synthase [Thermoanaerobaculia bacterium]
MWSAKAKLSPFLAEAQLPLRYLDDARKLRFRMEGLELRSRTPHRSSLIAFRLSPFARRATMSSVAELVPYPFASLASRMFRELEQHDSIFDLPRRKFFTGAPDLDFSARFSGGIASSPLGPAAGPHTQMAQNIVLAWLGGARIFELKTVQVRDDLVIPRPCIDMRTVGYNAEWSQELKIAESLEEYVKAAMLIAMLRQSGAIGLAPGFGDSIFDMSVGYDLAGIRSEKVGTFLGGMLDASAAIERLRREIPPELGRLRDVELPSRISNTLTLSTFHGCPPEEIERIVEYLMREWGIHCVVKFNPTLLGRDEVGRLLHDVLGYTDIHVPDSAFERDTSWPRAVEITEKLAGIAASLGLSFGVKFSNTLIVENTGGFLPSSEKEVYLSGQPLHVLAVSLVCRFRGQFGDRIPISFSAGIDPTNYAGAVALGLVPITVCTDLLKPGGYGRLASYHERLGVAMRACGAKSIDEYIVKVNGGEAETDPCGAGTPACASPKASGDVTGTASGGASHRAQAGVPAPQLSDAKLRNTELYADRAAADPRYSRARNSKLPPRIDSRLETFDCLTCDKCIPVCPNDANFSFVTGRARIPVMVLRGTPERPEIETADDVVLEHEEQIATFADFCNECGNCDVFCPEEGGPYQFKPLFFGSEAEWSRWKERDGFYVRGALAIGRVKGNEYRLEVDGTHARFRGDGFDVELELADPGRSIRGTWSREVDLTWCFIMDLLRRSVLDPSKVNYVNSRL